MRLIFIIYIIISGVGNDNDRINMARFLCIGESQPMGVLHLPTMLICSKVPVASHLLRSLKVRFNPNIFPVFKNSGMIGSGIYSRLGNTGKYECIDPKQFLSNHLNYFKKLYFI